MISKILKGAVPVILVVAGVLIAGWMMNTRPQAQRTELEELTTTIEVMETVYGTEPIIVQANGTVMAARQVMLSPEVAGRVKKVNPRLVPGGTFRNGELLVKIDDRDYQFNVEARKEMVANATYLLKMEQSQQVVAKQEWEMIGETVPATEQGRELALRIPQIEKAEATLEAARSALEKAELDKTRTELMAPFNAIVITKSVEAGQVVSPQTPVATLAGTDQYWVQVSIPLDNLSLIDVPGLNGNAGSKATISYTTGNDSTTVQGHVFRLLGDLDKAGRLARVLIAVDDPLTLKKPAAERGLPLLLGSYVSVEIEGHEMVDVFKLPRYSLRDAEETIAGQNVNTAWVWIMNNEDRLELREVGVKWRTRSDVFVDSGLVAGERLVISSIPSPIVGMKLSLEDANQ